MTCESVREGFYKYMIDREKVFVLVFENYFSYYLENNKIKYTYVLKVMSITTKDFVLGISWLIFNLQKLNTQG